MQIILNPNEIEIIYAALIDRIEQQKEDSVKHCKAKSKELELMSALSLTETRVLKMRFEPYLDR